MTPRQERKRPSLTFTLDPEHVGRLRALVDRMPGATVSRLVDDALSWSLPVLEEIADAYYAARRPDGSHSDQVFRERIGAFLAVNIAKVLQGTTPENTDGGDAST